MEEVRVVQEFLVQVKEEENDDILDNLTSEELLERLERLETLQDLKSSNENNVMTIDQSARDADVQRALEKNPDISKERTNLLQGWSNVSGSLVGRITIMRRRAEMVQCLERAVMVCEDSMVCYRDYVDLPLPPSVVLDSLEKSLMEKMVTKR